MRMTHEPRHIAYVQRVVLDIAWCAVDGGSLEDCARQSGIEVEVAKRLLAHPMIILFICLVSVLCPRRHRPSSKTPHAFEAGSARGSSNEDASGADPDVRHDPWRDFLRRRPALREPENGTISVAEDVETAVPEYSSTATGHRTAGRFSSCKDLANDLATALPAALIRDMISPAVQKAA